MKEIDKELLYAFTVDEIKEAIENGADVNSRDEKGNSPLHLVWIIEIVKALVEAGADVNSKNDEGQTPLHYASAENSEFLIDAGANVDAKDEMGNTPLHQAFFSGKAQVLIDAGADISARNKEGLTPSQTVPDKGAQFVIETELLKRANERTIKDSLMRQQAVKEQVQGQRF
ncbi:ankyrin repeat domain-containing protein [Stenotrophomonas maltophilia]|uniref:ankyrin repeat domain-containing protein n=1 Tax=Stenotrophomonas maltophilia TaxID=40324 RepID=UPI0012FD7357|nr:ankyrin repeat domain-containing protein [Stenotrophomonas maltophilia]